jgi:hypothetical protein
MTDLPNIDDLPELTPEERIVMDAMDMTPILGTWEERHAVAMNAAKRYMREARELRQQLAAAQAENERLRGELTRVADGVRYWCYCMSEGMRATCPEKVEELTDFLISLKIAPYYVRTNDGEHIGGAFSQEAARAAGGE